ncbi:MAG: glycosyltransferase, partial [Anaerolineae bacterium]|nr:glycosyltransferase [Anaerolineae bacterium]
MHYNIAVVEWSERDGIAAMICDELIALGHSPKLVPPQTNYFEDVDVVFSFGPYGEFLLIPQKLQAIPFQKRPVFVHWNTEGLPDLRLPWPVTRALGDVRSLIGRLKNSRYSLLRNIANIFPLSWVNSRMFRFRYVGDYYYAQQKGWLEIFADSSTIYGAIHNHHGLTTTFIPWGASPRNYANLNLERDIDVLWMGNRDSKRRSKLIDQVRAELKAHGVEMYVADGIEAPFIFDDERTEILNRAKITLNLTRTWYDDNFSRFSLAAPNRSLIVSEPVLPHCPPFIAGVHYVSAPIEKLTETILYYLGNDAERQKIVENAYSLVTSDLTFKNSIQTMVKAVDDLHAIYPTRDFALKKITTPILNNSTSAIPAKPLLERHVRPDKSVTVVPQKKSVRALMIAPQPFFEPRGTPISVFQRLEALSKLGYQVDLLTYHVGQDVEFDGVCTHRISRIPFIKQVKIGPSWSKLILDIFIFIKAVKLLLTNRYDIIHTHEEGAFLALPLAKLFRTPHIYDMHSSLPRQLDNFRFGNFWPILPLFRILERLVLHSCDGLITIGTDLEHYASEINPKVRHVRIENLAIHNSIETSFGTSTELKHRLQLDDKALVVYTGTFERYQGLDLLLESAQLVVKKHPDTRFILVGGNPEQVQFWRSEAKKLNLGKETLFVGQVSPSEATIYQDMADILVSPRIQGTSVPL